ncbi:MAG TPA: ankyrin repeat domain-containing protein [Rhodocyclaceae bacterium]|nr:ankyrin repeat domain-containing protein [Rhodocyclaceae bacterium]
MKNTLRPLIFGCALAAASTSVLAGAYDDLIAAVYRDDTNAVMDLVNRGMDVNSVDPGGNTLLHVAARNGNDALIAALIKQKANPNARNRVGDTPLALAAYNGKKAALDALLTAGAQINSPGWSALHYAVFAEQPEIVAHLLSKGAQVDLRAPNQQTALMLAAKNGNIGIVRMLLNAKADPRLKDQNDDTPLTLARQSNNSTVAQLLEQSDAPAAEKLQEGGAAAK